MFHTHTEQNSIEHEVLAYSAKLLKKINAGSLFLGILIVVARSLAYLKSPEEGALKSIPITLITVFFNSYIQLLKIDSMTTYNRVILVYRSVLTIAGFEIILSLSCQKIFSIFFVTKLVAIIDQYQIFNQSHQILQTFFLNLYFLIRSSQDREKPLATADFILLLLATSGSYLQFYYTSNLFIFLRRKVEQVKNLEQKWFNTLKNQNNGVALLTVHNLKLEFINNSMKQQFGIDDQLAVSIQEQLFSVNFKHKESSLVTQITLEALLSQGLLAFKHDLELDVDQLNKQLQEALCHTFKIKSTKRIVELSTLVFKEQDQYVLQLMSKDVTAARSLEKSKQLERMKSVYFCSVAHDLKTPINSIMATNQHLLNRFEKDKNSSKLFKINLSSCEFLLRIIQDVTDLSKIEMKQFEIEKQWYSLKSLIQEVMDIMSFSLELKNLDFGFKIDNSLLVSRDDCLIYSDPKRIKQVLLNLVGNALKFTFNGKIQILVRAKPEQALRQQEDLNLQNQDANPDLARQAQSQNYQGRNLNHDLFEEVEEEEQSSDADIHNLSQEYVEDAGEIIQNLETIEFKVVDTGIGIQEEDLTTLFKLFGKVKQKNDINKQGIGLGLTICKKITELLDGDIVVESEYGKGSTFIFTIKTMIRRGDEREQRSFREAEMEKSFIQKSISRYSTSLLFRSTKAIDSLES